MEVELDIDKALDSFEEAVKEIIASRKTGKPLSLKVTVFPSQVNDR
jgi:hypothetical protein